MQSKTDCPTTLCQSGMARPPCHFVRIVELQSLSTAAAMAPIALRALLGRPATSSKSRASSPRPGVGLTPAGEILLARWGGPGRRPGSRFREPQGDRAREREPERDKGCGAPPAQGAERQSCLPISPAAVASVAARGRTSMAAPATSFGIVAQPLPLPLAVSETA